MPYNKLTDNDKKLIETYIERFNSGDTPSCTLEHLLRYWSIAKSEYLLDMFGGEFILRREINYERSKDQTYNDFCEAKRKPAIRNFINKFLEIVNANWTWTDRMYNHLYYFENVDAMMASHYSGPSMLVTLNGESVLISEGMKTQKAYKHLAKFFGLEREYEEFRLECSRVLNTQKLTGNLCISIHPMDYMTMSDNSYHWDSCMSWTNEGCYRAGTVEMMNSPMVVVAYLEGDTPCEFTRDMKWQGNKKWRELFIVHPSCITGIKGYPYAHYELQDTVLKWLRELAVKNLQWNIPEEQVQFYNHDADCRITFDFVEDNSIAFNEEGEHWYMPLFEVTTMYNDFDTDFTKHMGYLFNTGDWSLEHSHYINYSGTLICMECGDTFWAEDGDEGRLVCYNCYGGRTYCCCCDERWPSDEIRWVGDDPYCPECFSEHCFVDAIDDEYYHESDGREIYLALVEDVPNEDFSFPCSNWSSTHLRASWNGRNYFVEGFNAVRYNTEQGLYYVNIADLTDNGLNRLFDFRLGHSDPNLLECIEQEREYLAEQSSN